MATHKEIAMNRYKVNLIKQCMKSSFTNFDELDWQILMEEEKGFSAFIDALCVAMEKYKNSYKPKKTNKYAKNKTNTLPVEDNRLSNDTRNN